MTVLHAPAESLRSAFEFSAPSLARTDSVRTAWSSAELPFVLDSGIRRPSADTVEEMRHPRQLSSSQSVASTACRSRTVTPPPVPLPLAQHTYHPDETNPPWLAKLSPPKTSPFKQKRRPPALQLESSSSMSMLRSMSGSSTTLFDAGASSSFDATHQPSSLARHISRPREEPPAASLFDPNYTMAPAPGQLLRPVSSTPAVRPPSYDFSQPDCDSLRSSGCSSQATDSIGLRTPENHCVPLAMTTTMIVGKDLAGFPQYRLFDSRNGSLASDTEHLKVQPLPIRVRKSSLTKAPARSRPSTMDTRIELPAQQYHHAPQQLTHHQRVLPQVEEPPAPIKARMPASADIVRNRSRTLGSLERPQTTGLLFTAPQMHSIDLRDGNRHSALSADDAYALDGVTPQLSPTQLSFMAESASVDLRQPRTSKTAPRPKSQGGWAAYLRQGLQLRIEQEGGNSSTIMMQYMSYDPFGRPESLAQDASRPPTPRRPKSRSSKEDGGGAEDTVGILHFAPSTEASHMSFLAANTPSCPVLRHVAVSADTRADLLTKQAALLVASNGAHEAAGFERKGRLAWRFVYEVQDFPDGGQGSLKLIKPVSFACSATVLDPERARKSRLLKLVKKQIGSQIVATPLSAAPSMDTYTDDARSAVSSPQHSNASRNPRESIASSQPTSPGRGEAQAAQPAADARPASGLVPFKMVRSKLSKASLRQAAKLYEEAVTGPLPTVPALPADLTPPHLASASTQPPQRPVSSQLQPQRSERSKIPSRPATASELIKEQYLCRQEAAQSVLRPDAFSNVDARERRKQLRTAEDTMPAVAQLGKCYYPPRTPPRKSRPRTSQGAEEDYPVQTALVDFSPSREL